MFLGATSKISQGNSCKADWTPDAWTAWMEEIPGYEDRCIMVRSRSRSSAFDALDSYHRHDPTSDLAAVHKNVKDAIQRDPSRHAHHYRIIIPKKYNMRLDNVILSGDSRLIKKNETGVSYMMDDIDCKAYFVNWTIAKKKAGHQLETSAKTPLRNRFA